MSKPDRTIKAASETSKTSKKTKAKGKGRKRQSLTLYVPQDFDPLACLRNPKHADYARWVVSYVAGGPGTREEETGWLPVPWQTWDGWLPERAYAAIVDDLKRAGVIECDESYYVGQGGRSGKCLYFRLGQAWLDRPLVRVQATKGWLLKNAAKARQRRLEAYLPVHHHLERWLHRLRFDTPRAMALIAGERAALPPLDNEESELARVRWRIVQDTQVRRLGERLIDTSVCSYGRFHSPYTSLAKPLRDCISYRGEPLVGLDVVNCQPLLLCALMHIDILGDGALTQAVREWGSIARAMESLPGFFRRYANLRYGLSPGRQLPELMRESTRQLVGAALEGKFYEELALHLRGSWDAHPQGPAVDGECVADGDQEHGGGVCVPPADDPRSVIDPDRRWAGVTPEERKRAKAATFPLIYGSTALHGQKLDFSAAFPQVWRWAVDIKDAIRIPSNAKSERDKPLAARKLVAEYRTLCLLAQRFESYLVIDKACDRLRREHPETPLVTIHDSLLTTPGHVETVRGVLEDTFSGHGVPAHFAVSRTAAEPTSMRLAA